MSKLSKGKSNLETIRGTDKFLRDRRNGESNPLYNILRMNVRSDITLCFLKDVNLNSQKYMVIIMIIIRVK